MTPFSISILSRSRAYLVPWLLVSTWAGIALAAEPAPSLPATTPNRTLPAVSPPKRGLMLGENPSVKEIGNCPNFSFRLLPTTDPSEIQKSALVAALKLSFADEDAPDVEPLAAFARENPDNPWTPAVILNVGLAQYAAGWFSKALESFETAWERTRASDAPESKLIANRALAEAMKINARVGRVAELEAQFAALSERELDPESASIIGTCETALATMKERPEIAFRCGPLAVGRVLNRLQTEGDWFSKLMEIESPVTGFSMAELKPMAATWGGELQIAKRKPGAEVIIPSVVHWKLNHYAALARRSKEGLILAEDATFVNETWMSEAALDHEASGYFLVPAGPLPAGWTPVADAEAATVFGKGFAVDIDDDPTDCDATPHAGLCDREDEDDDDKNSCGMARYGINLMQVGLTVTDTPLEYAPPVGPKIRFTLRFHERRIIESNPIAFGLWQWSLNWGSWLEVFQETTEADVRQMSRSGGYRTHRFDSESGEFTPEYNKGTKLVLVSESPRVYLLRHPDGSIEKYSFVGPSSFSGRMLVYLTEFTDPHGNTVSLSYDEHHRLAAVSDAIGQVSTFVYRVDPEDPAYIDRRLASITDPFGRSTSFDYYSADASTANRGALKSITDVVGLESSFSYVVTQTGGAGGGSVSIPTAYGITDMTTPYGTTAFTRTRDGTTRRLTVTDPAGDSEVVEKRDDAPGLVYPQTGAPGTGQQDGAMGKRNTYYWDKKAWKETPNDYTKAIAYHWIHASDATRIGNSPQSIKRPFENPVWYLYPGQIENPRFYYNGTWNTADPASGARFAGTYGKPSMVVRQLEDGLIEKTSTAYNSQGNVVYEQDPMGRETVYVYAENGIDLVEVRRLTGDGTSAVLHQATYDDRHLPLTTTDTAGQTTHYVWNALGQIVSVTNPKNETTTFTYYADDVPGKQRMHRLHQIDAALPGNGDVTTFDYDAYGRMASVTGPDGYYVNLAYDALDRLTRVTYPDGTYDETTYHRLDPQTRRDRMGRITSYVYNSIRQLEQVTDPANRTIRYRWCKCGDLRQLIDAMGRITSWKHDVGGRMTAKVYADGSTIKYAYRPDNGRLSSITDAKGQIKNYSYDLDGSLTTINYEKEEHHTPDVKFTYDVHFRRLKTMKDGIGTTSYDYHPELPGTLGAGQLARVDGPLVQDDLTYTYDELGRRTGYAINGVGESNTFDALGRVATVTNPLGDFDYAYAPNTARVTSMTYPNGMTATYDYHPLAGDFRLKDIIHTLPGNTPLSRHSYEYNPVGNITRWTQINTPAGLNRSWLCGYDEADQLTSVTSQDPVTLANLPMGQYAYSYDLAGNRLSETIDGNTTTATHNALNQLVSQTGPPAAVAEHSYEWDANDRLIAINYPGTNQKTEFKYDGQGLMRVALEEDGGNLTNYRQFIWKGATRAEERNASGNGVTRRYFSDGLQQSSVGGFLNQMIPRDHLASVRAVVSDSDNGLSTFDYDPWGKHSPSSGQTVTGFGFSGHWHHDRSNLSFAPFRSFSASTSRWLNRDPIQEFGGLNIYLYATNNPVTLTDPLGLWPWRKPVETIGGRKMIETLESVYQRLFKKVAKRNMEVAKDISDEAFDAAEPKFDPYAEEPSCESYGVEDIIPEIFSEWFMKEYKKNLDASLGANPVR